MATRLSVIGGVVLAGMLTAPIAAAQDGGCTGDITLTQGPEGTVHLWSADDPRMTGEVTIEEGWSFYPPASEVSGEPQDAADYDIVTPEGGWHCVSSVPAGPEPDLTGHQLVFAGDGDFEGLHAYVTVDWAGETSAFSAYITDEPPPADPMLQG
jgi:hypothetical protein